MDLKGKVVIVTGAGSGVSHHLEIQRREGRWLEPAVLWLIYASGSTLISLHYPKPPVWPML